MDPTNLYHLILFILFAISVCVVIFYHSYIRYCSPLSPFWIRFQVIPLSVMLLLWIGIIVRYSWMTSQSIPDPNTPEGQSIIQRRIIWSHISFVVLSLGVLLTCVAMFSQLGKFGVASREGIRVTHASLWDGFKYIPNLFSTCEPLRRKSMDISAAYAIPPKVAPGKKPGSAPHTTQGEPSRI